MRRGLHLREKSDIEQLSDASPYAVSILPAVERRPGDSLRPKEYRACGEVAEGGSVYQHSERRRRQRRE
jgi:hypothetical protein